MNIDHEKDYYGTLGVTPKAELAVIKAAYKALASIYHPDKNSSADAAKKMSAINEAWEILSNSATREKYDEARSDINEEQDIFGDAEADTADTALLEKGWELALSYYPHLKGLSERLAKISWRLSIAFKAHLLEEKEFDQSHKIAEKMEDEFLKTYFGEQQIIIKLAKDLIFIYQDKELLRELNRAVTTLGSSSAKAIVERFRLALPESAEDEEILKEAKIRINKAKRQGRFL